MVLEEDPPVGWLEYQQREDEEEERGKGIQNAETEKRQKWERGGREGGREREIQGESEREREGVR